jgi:hypothetical protein
MKGTRSTSSLINIFPCFSGFLECKIYRKFGFALVLAFHSKGDVLDFEYEGLRVFGDPLRMVHLGCGVEVSLFYIVQFFIFLKTTPGVEPRLRRRRSVASYCHVSV